MEEFMTIKKLSISILITFLIVISLSACLGEPQSNSAKIVISLGGANRAVYNPEDSATHEKLVHKIVLKSETETLNFTAAGGIFEANVAPGNWNIEVVSYLDGDVYAKGEKDVTLISGLNNETIAMYQAHLVKFVSNGGSAVEEQVIYHAQKIKSDNINTSHPKSLQFVGWYDFMEELFDFDNKRIFESIILYAKWGVSTIPEEENTLLKKLEWIKENAVNGENYIVKVEGDISFDETLPLPTNASVNITLISDKSEMRTITRSGSGALFTVNSGVTLTLGSYITLKGSSDNNSSLVSVWSNGKLIMNPLSKIKDNKTGNNDVYGGGVFLYGGTLLMNGGEISGNTAKQAGGVWIQNNGTFIMNDGKIFDNTTVVEYGGGGVKIYYGTFTMNGGEISGNKAEGKILLGGGVYVHTGSTFTMNGGKISGNDNITNVNDDICQGGGVYVGEEGTFIMNDGEISGNKTSSGSGLGFGGGVSMYRGTFTMNGGKIIGNTANSNIGSGGGGVYVEEGTFTMTGGTISGNKAEGPNLVSGWYVGGGVYVYQGQFNMTGGNIINNTADRRGGGVHLDNNSTFNMRLGTIQGNYITNLSSDSFGGGVCVHQNSTFTMNSGKIIGNTANSNIGSGGGGVNINASTFTMNDGEISSNITSGKGGGVFMTYDVTFTKSSGIIYGDNGDNNKNTASSNIGHAVFVENMDNSTLRKKETTVNYPLSYNGKGNGAFTGDWN
jgi:hypothetical protein